VLNVNGYKPVKASKPGATASSSDPVKTRRGKFVKSIDSQLKMLETGWQKPAGQKARDPRWFWRQGEAWFTGVRYGSKSLLAEGEAFKFEHQDELEDFYQALKEQCMKGDFDGELKKLSDEMKGSTAGALEAARAARMKKAKAA
jgi:hypothetical protein